MPNNGQHPSTVYPSPAQPPRTVVAFEDKPPTTDELVALVVELSDKIDGVQFAESRLRGAVQVLHDKGGPTIIVQSPAYQPEHGDLPSERWVKILAVATFAVMLSILLILVFALALA